MRVIWRKCTIVHGLCEVWGQVGKWGNKSDLVIRVFLGVG